MIKNYKFNSIEVDIQDGVLDAILNLETSPEIVSLLNYPITKLKNKIFYSNDVIKEIKLPSSLEEISGYTIYYCNNLEKINIPENIKKITDASYFLENSKIKNNEENWVNDCFCYDGWLLDFRGKNIVLPVGYKYGTNLNTTGVEKIEVPANVREIPDYFLSTYNTSLTQIILNEGLEIVGKQSFTNSSISEIKIPSTIKKIGFNSLNTTTLKKVIITDLKKWCEIDFENYTVFGYGNHDLYINNTLTNTISIPTSITKIKKNSFAFSNIIKLNIPSSISIIEENSFSFCDKLNEINFNGTMSQWKNITKEYSWNFNIPATYVQCTDGQVQL